jgi:tRNA wybutosine-synthesizing protein 3
MSGKGPHSKLEDAVRNLYYGSLPGYLPSRWERFSDVAIMPHGSFEGDGWSPNESLWEAVAGALGAKRLARKGEVSGEFRVSGVEMLLGDDDWVVRRESGVDYGYPMTRCMFSAGNVNERRRMGEVSSEGEVVVDLYAGIGYYTLPALVHGGATVHACEWNPEAVKALRWGLDANGVEDRCTIHEGDNRVTMESLEGAANRAFLGLLPSSEDGLEIAMRVLSPDGGTLHIHGLAPPEGHSSWAEGVCATASSLRPGSDLSHELTTVKSYAPHWDHVVLDLGVA